jgi:hypothetical protein
MPASDTNLSKEYQREGDARFPKDTLDRGQPARFDPATGEVHGSGAGAGGSGSRSEDYDGDPHGGAGQKPLGGPQPAGTAPQRPIDPDEGV